MALDISTLTEAANANARGVAGPSRPRAAAPAAAPAKTEAKTTKPKATKPKASARPTARSGSGAKAAAASTATVARENRAGRNSKRRIGTVRLSLDVPREDAEAFRAFASQRRHSHETVFRVMVELLDRVDRAEYLDIAESLDE